VTAKKAKERPKRFWDAFKVRILSAGVILFVVLHMAQIFFADVHHQSMLKRGDFASFYAAGMIVRQGLGGQIYNPTLLQSVQNKYWPSLQGRFVLFPYPPFAAFFLLPFSWLPPLAAKAVFVLFMTICLIFALKLTARHAPVLNKNPLALAAFLLAFFPLNFSIAGGQNTALSMLLYAAVLYFWGENSPKTDWIAGICLGLWLFKPHYSLALAALFLCAGFYRVPLAMAMVGTGLHLLSTGIAGRDWIFRWFEMLRKYVALESQYNFFNMVSLQGFLDACSHVFAEGAFRNELSGLGFILSACLMAALLFAAVRLRKKEAPVRRYDLLKLLRAAMPVILLASPHTLFYDFGLCLVALALSRPMSGSKKTAKSLL
jgi:hypothetical protein